MSELTPEIKKYLKIMELPEDTTLPEIRKTYHHLKSLYANESSILAAAATDIEEEINKKDILVEIEHAYTELVKYFETTIKALSESHKSRVENNQIPEFECYNGNALKITREVMQITLHEIAFSSKIPVKLLEHIEKEDFAKLPPPAYIRAYIKTYARYLSLDENRVVTDYFKNTKGSDIKF